MVVTFVKAKSHETSHDTAIINVDILLHFRGPAAW